jgi:hypothetical protein
MALVCWTWIYDAHLLNAAFDANLALVKQCASVIDGSGRVEAALRGISADRMLLFTEAGILVWMACRIIWFPMSFLFSWRRQVSQTRQPVVTARQSTSRPKA